MRARIAGIIAFVVLSACAAERGDRDPFEEVVRREPESNHGGDPYTGYLLGRYYEETGRVPEAIESYRAAVEADSTAVDVLARLAELHLERREFEPAVRYAERAVDLDPGREDALTALAKGYLESGRGEEAIGRFEKLALQKEDGTIRYLLSVLYQSRGEQDRALLELEKAVDLAPGRAFYRLRLGDSYHRRNDFERAEAAYRKAIDLAENDGPVRSALARMYGDAGRWEEAAAIYEDLAAKGHRPREAHDRLVAIYLRLGRGEDALRHAEAMRVIDPENRKLRGEIADLYISLGREEEGIAELESVWKEDPEDLAPAKRMTEIRIARERFQEAEALLRRMLAVRPEDAWTWTRLSYVLIRLGDSPGSLEALEKAVAIDPADGGVLYLLGNAYFARGRLEEALVQFQRAYERGQRTADLLSKRAIAEAELGRSEAAIATLRELLALEPENASAQNHLGYLLADMGRDLEEAEALVLRALEQRPLDPFFRDSLGWVYFRRGEHEKAVRELRQARAGRPADPVILEHLGDALAAAGRDGEAIEAYGELLRLRPESEGAARKLRAMERP